MRAWDWHLHSLRVAVLYCLGEDEQNAAATKWPEPLVRDSELSGMDAEVGSECDTEDEEVIEGKGEVQALVDRRLEDECKLNEALEVCRYDYSHKKEYEGLVGTNVW